MLIQILNGLVYGGLLYIVSVGLVLIFGLRRIVNFAHGSLFMIGAYIGFSVAAVEGFWGAALAATVIMGLIGALLDLTVFQPLRRQDSIVTVLVTFGLLMVLEDFAQTIWGKDYLKMPVPPLLSGSVSIFGDSFPAYRLFVIVVAGAVALGLSAWLRASRIGLYVRAASADPFTTAMQGVDTDRVSVVVVGLGTALAGLSGTISAPLLALSPSMGSYILIESFIVVVVGGLGSFAGAFVAAIVIGQVHNISLVYVPWAATMIPFVLMVIVLIWRPTGIAGSRA
jgi:branched-chain amino acid transport system permease protein